MGSSRFIEGLGERFRAFSVEGAFRGSTKRFRSPIFRPKGATFWPRSKASLEAGEDRRGRKLPFMRSWTTYYSLLNSIRVWLRRQSRVLR